MQWVYNTSTPLFTLLMVALMVGASCGAHVLVRRIAPHEVLKRHNDVAGFVSSLIGVIYAVLLAFVVVVVWQEYDNAVSVAQQEASAVGDLYHLGYGFPPALQSRLHHDLARYINLMITDEWPLMQYGLASSKTERVGHQILHDVMDFKPAGPGQGGVQATALQMVQTFFDARRQRLSENTTSVPRILWFTLVIGAIFTIGFTFFFGMENGRIQLSMTAAIAAMIALMFVLIIELDFPFRGATRIPPKDWLELQQNMGTGLTENVYRS
ncbi:MAG: DUF4239 domain-containing protein [Candidatus Eremiobacteraeota bacterium]|nr:DUF4239 domain-containing protein [Candidatus Eremiobacteraeota bacterium]MBV9972211.1 DUF4239 domain-containing protein [Candidatus Eremiobacteraeota bacterium]